MIAEVLPEIGVTQQYINGLRLLPNWMIEQAVSCCCMADHGEQLYRIAQQICIVWRVIAQFLRKPDGITYTIPMPREARRQQTRTHVSWSLNAQRLQLRMRGSYLSLL